MLISGLALEFKRIVAQLGAVRNWIATASAALLAQDVLTFHESDIRTCRDIAMAPSGEVGSRAGALLLR